MQVETRFCEICHFRAPANCKHRRICINCHNLQSFLNYLNYVRIIIVLKSKLEFLHQPKNEFMIILKTVLLNTAPAAPTAPADGAVNKYYSVAGAVYCVRRSNRSSD